MFDILEKYPDRYHTIGQSKNRYDTHLLTVMQYNAVEQKMNEQADPIASVIVEGDRIISVLQYL